MCFVKDGEDQGETRWQRAGRPGAQGGDGGGGEGEDQGGGDGVGFCDEHV